MANPLVELDSLEILVIIDNELDPISPCPNPNVQQSGNLKDISALDPLQPSERGSGPSNQLRMSNICCSAHGLSLLITATKGPLRHTLLFDTGPEESAFERNATRLRAPLAAVEHIHLSHWHRDHSGGMLRAIPMILAAQEQEHNHHHHPANNPTEKRRRSPLVVDVHPDRPTFRGTMSDVPVSMEADPTLDAITQAGAQIRQESTPHTVLEDMFLISGEIPRVTAYEKGLKRGIRFLPDTQEWVEDTMIRDERFVMCNLKGKGLVLFTGCSHAGVVNASKDAVRLGGPNDGTTPLYAIMGGYHLADADGELIGDTVRDLGALDAKILLAGHCTGWRAKFAMERDLPGRLVPSFVGSRFVL